MTINNKSERNYRGKCLGWPVTSYGAGTPMNLASALSCVNALDLCTCINSHNISSF